MKSDGDVGVIELNPHATSVGTVPFLARNTHGIFSLRCEKRHPTRFQLRTSRFIT